MKLLIIVWDGAIEFAHIHGLPGVLLLVIGLAAVLGGCAFLGWTAAGGVYAIWIERQERKTRIVNEALRRAQRENDEWIKARRKQLSVVARFGGRS
jgi:sugar (pentulose or hexulose) kinase